MIQIKSDNATILAIDSATGPCSAALWKNCEILGYREELLASRQAGQLLPMIEDVLGESGVNYRDLSSIAVTNGPGSFTGIRIALSAARGIGMTANVPVYGFSALDVLAYGAGKYQRKLPILAMLNAGKGEIIYQHYTPDMEALGEPLLGTMDDILAHISTHTLVAGSKATGNHIEHVGITFPRANLLARLAARYPHFACAPIPFYVRPPDAKISVKAAS